MSVTETYKPVLLETDGSETDFDFDFSVFDDTDLVVALVDPDTLVATAQTLGVDYTVTLNTSTVGGTVVFGTAPADGQLVSIRRNIPTTQGTDIPSGGLFRESQIENALDKAILLIQQLEESVSRALLQSPYSEALDLQFPAPVAGTVLGWNSAEDGLENKTLSGTGVMAIASQAQAEAGTGNDTLMTPLRTAQATAELAQAIAELAAKGLNADTTVNFNSSMTSAQIQALIDAQPKNLNGHTLTFQFADGTYTLSTRLYFEYFFGGKVLVYGNMTENQYALHTNQGVSLDLTESGIYFYGCTAYCTVANIKFLIPDVESTFGINTAVTPSVRVNGCYFLGDAKTTNNSGVVSAFNSSLVTEYCNFSNVMWGVTCQSNSKVYSKECASTGTAPTYGNNAADGGVISLFGSSVSGTTLSYRTANGGQINQPTGAFPAAAWVNFNGTGTPAIRASGNVSSITDNGTGKYTVNFTTAMPDVKYSAVASAGTSVSEFGFLGVLPSSASNCGIEVYNAGYKDYQYVSFAAFR